MSYNINGWEKSISELHGMLKTVEMNIPSKTTQVLMIREGKVKKNKGKNFKGNPQAGKGKGKKAPQDPPPPPKKKEKVAKDDTCFECGDVRHWKRNCPKYLALLKNKKVGEGPSGISIFMIEMALFTFSSNTWVLDTGCGTYICKRNCPKYLGQLKNKKVGEGPSGHFDLFLPSCLYLTLDNARLITSINRNIILVSSLRKSGYDFKFVDDNIHSFLKGIFYFEARPINGIYELNLDNTSNNKSLYHVNTRKPKLDLNQTYLSGSECCVLSSLLVSAVL
uniref:CCHC-type domain-containing protein n=1 Tax=Lactuca sativa TaxID=4236 RepID=A0A9R1VBH2_LACSA|nr:hypothetical protein LSAT_V11C600305960 [Lactuca sativa]